MLKLSEISEFSKEKFRKIPILKEFEWFEWFECFGPSPIEPFNSAPDRCGQASLHVWLPVRVHDVSELAASPGGVLGPVVRFHAILALLLLDEVHRSLHDRKPQCRYAGIFPTCIRYVNFEYLCNFNYFSRIGVSHMSIKKTLQNALVSGNPLGFSAIPA